MKKEGVLTSKRSILSLEVSKRILAIAGELLPTYRRSIAHGKIVFASRKYTKENVMGLASQMGNHVDTGNPPARCHFLLIGIVSLVMVSRIFVLAQ
jgi:hypothetical protein